MRHRPGLQVAVWAKGAFGDPKPQSGKPGLDRARVAGRIGPTQKTQHTWSVSNCGDGLRVACTSTDANFVVVSRLLAHIDSGTRDRGIEPVVLGVCGRAARANRCSPTASDVSGACGSEARRNKTGRNEAC
jgi:hypothetical protein